MSLSSIKVNNNQVVGIDSSLNYSENLIESKAVYDVQFSDSKIFQLNQSYSFELLWDSNYTSEDDYSIYLYKITLSGFYTRGSIINTLSSLGLELVNSPISGNPSIRIPNDHSLCRNNTDGNFEIVPNRDFNIFINNNYTQILINYWGRGKKTSLSFDEFNDVFIIHNYKIKKAFEISIYNNTVNFFKSPFYYKEDGSFEFLNEIKMTANNAVSCMITPVLKAYENDEFYVDYFFKNGVGNYLKIVFYDDEFKYITSLISSTLANNYSTLVFPERTCYFQAGISFVKEYNTYDDVIFDLQYSKFYTEPIIENSIIKTNSSNLYNADTIIRNYRLSYDACPRYNQGSIISDKIYVKENTKYYFIKSLSVNEVTIESFDKFNRYVGRLLDTAGNIIEPYYFSIHNRLTFIVPKNTQYIRLSVCWFPIENEMERLNASEYEIIHNYYIYEYDKYIEEQRLLNDKTERVEYVSLPEELYQRTRIDIHSSDKIGFFSNSFLEGYAMYGKHAIEKVMMFSDYIGFNYSVSGDDMVELSSRLNNDQNILGICKPSEIGNIKYGIIMHQDNDGVVYSFNHKAYYENAKHLGYLIKSLGAQPIISTEHDQETNYVTFQSLCDEEGWEFMDWGKYVKDFNIGVYSPLWLSSHPATRTNWYQVNGFLPTIMSLPKPSQSIKLFRLRSTIDSSDLKNLMYNTVFERAEKFIELHNGQNAITSGQEKRFDRWKSGGYNAGSYDITKINDEYQNLIKKTTTSFGNFMLVDITVPYNIRDVKSFELNIFADYYSNVNVINKIYARSLRYDSDSYFPSQNQYYISFIIESGKENIHEGSTFTISGITRSDGQNLNGNYTVKGISNNYLVTTTYGTSYVTSGTDRPICSISGVSLIGSYKMPDSKYMNNFDKPVGKWEEVPFYLKFTYKYIVTLTKEQIEKFGTDDKFVFLITGSNIQITDIYADVCGANKKNSVVKNNLIPEPKNGTSLLYTNTLTDDDLSYWQNLSNIRKVSPITDGSNTEILPENVVRELNTGEWISQTIRKNLIQYNKYTVAPKFQIQIVARWFPKYILTDDDYNTSELTPDTFDMSKLEISLNSISNGNNDYYNYYLKTLYIGAWWNVYTFEFTYINVSWTDLYNNLVLKCIDKRVQIAWVNMVQIL